MAVGYKSGIAAGSALSLGATLFRPWRPAVSRYGRPLAHGKAAGPA